VEAHGLSLLKELAGHPEWIGVHKQAEKMRPAIPAWDSKSDNTDEWKKQSAMQEGFDLCWQLFKPK
jgi:hypothetical protein